VISVPPDATVAQAAELMLERGISGVLVVDASGTLAGIVTEGDLLRRAEAATERQRSRWSEWFSSSSRLAAEYVKSHARRLADIMSRDIVSVLDSTTLVEIAELMETRRIKRVPVVRDGKLIGIVSRCRLPQGARQ